MARYAILGEFLVVPKPMPIGEAETADEAVRMARAFVAKGRRGVRIGDTQAEDHYSIEEFAAKHGVR